MANFQETKMTPERETLIRRLFEEVLDRILRGEEPDPAMAVVAALCRGQQVPDAELELILHLHLDGPWAFEEGKDDFETFVHWCNVSGSPLQIGEAVEIEGLRVYVANFGDCCFAEAARGARFAVWTRKGRLHIGFRNEADAVAFRAADNLFSMERTGNKRTAFVVVEGGDTPETIAKAAVALAVIG